MTNAFFKERFGSCSPNHFTYIT